MTRDFLPARPLLLIDAGNSRTKLGLFDGTTPQAGVLPVCSQLTRVDTPLIPDWAAFDAAMSSEGAVLCLTGSNPRFVNELLRQLPAQWPTPCELPPRHSFPIGIQVDYPERVGIDRLLNCIAANWLRAPGQAAVTVSSGTATTIDYLDGTGNFRGGAILPGFEMSARALHQYTALLPLLGLPRDPEQAPPEVGRNTEAAMQSGLYWGHVGGVRELLRRFLQLATSETASRDPAGSEHHNRHLGNLTDAEAPLVLVTGGAAPLVIPHLPSFCRLEPALALQGLAILLSPHIPPAR